LVFVGEFKQNVTRQTWRALFHFGDYLFQSTHYFHECLKKMVSHTETTMTKIYKLKKNLTNTYVQLSIQNDKNPSWGYAVAYTIYTCTTLSI
jgi:hypothetical protein